MGVFGNSVHEASGGKATSIIPLSQIPFILGALSRLNVLYTAIHHIEHSHFNVDRDEGISRGCRDEWKRSNPHQRSGGIKNTTQSQEVRKDMAAWLVRYLIGILGCSERAISD